ncbi:hypothetical protein CH339_19390 [Rhodobium orientis]|uniref:Uncharacterized protein n=2 Tax=Rhodobium orientis TaxID=34017 RepID=A0A327JGC4_9HYPH|nr:hypothetical protein [Rhodobium orientis]RAI25175.1 hypothetical protein CH339_19390 [Rhodobium orientis]
MGRQGFLIAILAFAIVSGIFSPFRLVAHVVVLAMAPGFFVASPSVVLLVSSLLTATVTVMLGGVPAAVFERATGKTESDAASLWLWLAGVALLSLPAIQTVIAIAR